MALGAAVSNLLVDEEIDKLELLRQLCDAGKMMTQVHRGFFSARRAFISPGFNKQVRDTLECTSPDKFLYGLKLSEKVKKLKSIAKLGQDLKITSTPSKKPNSVNSKSPFVRFKKP